VSPSPASSRDDHAAHLQAILSCPGESLGQRSAYRSGAAISGIVARDDAIVITISLVKLTVTVAIYVAALLVIIFLIVQLLRNPTWGLLALEGVGLDTGCQ